MQVAVQAGNMEAITLSAGSIIVALECLIPSTLSDFFDDDEQEHARVVVPKEGSLHFPAAFYSLSKHNLTMVRLQNFTTVS
jgi:hypothetical protein